VLDLALALPRLYALARQFKDDAEARQVAALGFCRAAFKFDAARGVKFSTYAGWHMLAALRRELDHRRAMGRSLPEGVYAVEIDETNEPPDPRPGPGEAAPDPSAWLDRAVAALPGRLREAARLRRQGLGFRGIAAELGVTPQRAHQIWKKALVRLKRRAARVPV
jgi:RNA polymerase sigma factor (sigma-70 family)